MFGLIKTGFCLVLLLIAVNTKTVHAESAELTASELEIQYLLQMVANTPCIFNRNGSRHSGPEAVAHIQRKYDYFKDDIETAEDFIRTSASRSTMSRKAYTIECAGEPVIESEVWLLQSLQNYRNNKMS